MKKLLILTSHLEGSDFLKPLPEDFDAVLCADGGLKVAAALGLQGDILIGDYDSGPLPTEEEKAFAKDLLVLPTVKDMTDTEAALDYAAEHGYEDLWVYGGLGGRLDHTLGNLGLLRKYAEDPRIKRLTIEDGYNRVRLLTPGTVRVPAPGTALPGDAPNRFSYFGLIAYGGAVKGLTITGAKYPLQEASLTPDTTLGVSNEVEKDAPFAEISHKEGFLLLVLSKDT